MDTGERERERERVPISTCVDGKILEIEIYLIVM
jgi:hypothetical protein